MFALNRIRTTVNKTLKYIGVLGWICFIFGCSGSLIYHPGIYTRFVKGKIFLESASVNERPFIIVRKHHKTFLKTSEGYLRRITASVIKPDQNGFYRIVFGTEVGQLDVMYFAKGFISDSFSFHRTLGIDSYEYNVALKPDKNWRNSFFLLMKPTLAEYIIEDRYRMTQADKLFIGDWLDEVENDFSL